MKTREFNIIKLEERIAPTAKPHAIPSVDLDNSAVNGAEHGLKGLNKSHASDTVVANHGGTTTS